MRMFIPDVRLTRSRDGSTGTATFRFANPQVLEAQNTNKGTITGMYLVDEEGELVTKRCETLGLSMVSLKELKLYTLCKVKKIGIGLCDLWKDILKIMD